MSKLLKLKLVLGVMIFAFVVTAGAFVADAAYMHTVTLKQGSTGSQVVELQKALGGLTADGKFGPMTKAAVMSFQTSKGLTADGVVGPVTGAALAGMGGSTGGGLPAGCTSTAGYSTTTGVKCDSGSTGLPAGCTSTAGYSPTTGVKCDSSAGSAGGLMGGAGDIDLTAKSTYSNEDVVAGEEDVPVLAFEVEADDGSDVEITNVKVEFIQSTAADSDDIDDYMESVSIFMDGEKVGESDADEFSESSNYWSDTIDLEDAIIEAGDTVVFYVAVTALNNLDSGDINSDAWEADLLSVRFKDAEGVTITETADAAGTANGTFSRDFDFDDLATSGDLELNLSLGDDSPDASSVEVDDTTTTDVTVLEFELTAEGSDMTIEALELTGTAVGVDDTWADMVSELTLEADGDDIDSISAYGDGVDDDTGDLWFTDLDYTIDEDDTVTFRVVAKVRAIAAGSGVGTAFDQGDSFLVSFTAANLADTTNTDVEDENGDTVAAGDRTGTGIGETQTFYSSGVAVDMGSVTYESVTDSGNVTQVTYTIPLMITSFGDTRYIGLSVEEDNDGITITDGKAISYAFQDSGAPATDIDEGDTTAVEAWSCSATIEGGTGYRLDEGDEVDCTLTVTLTADANTPGSYRVHVEGVETWTAAALNAGGVSQLLTPVEDFQTAFKLLSS